MQCFRGKVRASLGRGVLVYQQVYDPIASSLPLSALVAVIPIVVLFVLLAGIRIAAQWASLATLAVALVIAVAVYGMPLGLALNSTLLGICFGLFPIVWIVIITPCFRNTKTPGLQFSTRLPAIGIPQLRLSLST